MSTMKTAKKIKIKESPAIQGQFVIRQYEKGQIKYKTQLIYTKDNRVIVKYVVDKDSLKNATPCFEKLCKNKIVTGAGGYGANLLLRQMSGDITYSIELDEICFGTGTNPPSASDTGLQTETVTGIGFADTTLTNNVLLIDVFVPSGSMPDATYRELGLKMNGRLFTRSSMNYEKTTNKDTTLEYTITFNV
jgi:hypothetical protein